MQTFSSEVTINRSI